MSSREQLPTGRLENIKGPRTPYGTRCIPATNTSSDTAANRPEINGLKYMFALDCPTNGHKAYFLPDGRIVYASTKGGYSSVTKVEQTLITPPKNTHNNAAKLLHLGDYCTLEWDEEKAVAICGIVGASGAYWRVDNPVVGSLLRGGKYDLVCQVFELEQDTGCIE